MQNNIGTLFTPLFFFIVFSGCEFINPDEQVPSYIQIDEISLAHEDAIGITDAWVYVNTEFIGVFELPAKFPVLAEGETDIMISAGIKVNGVANSRSYYPFYTSYRADRILEPSETIVINPTLSDADYTTIAWKEGFENTHNFVTDDDSDTSLYISTSKPFSGAGCGVFYMDTSNNYFKAQTIELAIPKINANRGMYLEMNFKCNNYFAVGYIASDGEPKQLIILNHANEWKKIYIDLYNALSVIPEGYPYRIYIEAYLEADVEHATILIDDMRIVQ